MPFADLAGLAAHYRVDGREGLPSLVLLNSLGTDCRIWDDLASALRGRFRFLRYDQRGQGLTDSPAGPYSIRQHAGDLLALLDRVDWGPTVLCGLSIGGMIAMDACRQRPEAVRGLALADTCDVIGPRAIWDERMRQVRASGLGSLAGRVTERWFGTTFRQSRPTAARGWANLLARAPVEGYLGSCAALRDADLRDAVPGLGVPTVCICGSEDAATPPAEVRDLASRLPDAAYAEIERAGHLAPVERPGRFAEILVPFLEDRLGS